MSGPRRAAGVLLGLALALALTGIAVRLLLLPAYTSSLVIAVDAPVRAGLSPDETVRIAEAVRAYVVGARDASLPATLPDGRPAFDAKAVSHLDDVRDVLAGALIATAGFALIATAGIGVLLRRRDSEMLTFVLGVSGLALAVPVGIALLVAALDFERFFAGFHALFFKAGTWQFSHDALLIRVFPEPFWAASGVAWGALLFVFAVASGGLSRLVHRRASRVSA